MNRFLLLNRALAALLCATILCLAWRWYPAAWFALPSSRAQHALICQQVPGCAYTHTEVRYDAQAGHFAPYVLVFPVRHTPSVGKQRQGERVAVDRAMLQASFQSAYLARAQQAPRWLRSTALSVHVEVMQ